MRSFESLSEREILALAIAMEEEDSRIYADFAEGLRDSYPVTADIFDLMRKEEINHRQRLFETYKARWGEHIPLIRREDVKGFVKRRPFWLDASATRGERAQARQCHGNGDPPVLRTGRTPHSGCQPPAVARQPSRGGALACAEGR